MAVAALILYGSWFPFSPIWPDADDVRSALTDVSLRTSRADLLGNIALFGPWGLVAAWAARVRGRSSTAWSLVSALLLAVLAQAGQLFEAHRDPRWADVAWNLVGAGVGAAVFMARRQLPRQPSTWLVAGSALTAWLPLWPSLDPARWADQWSRLGDLGLWQGPEAAMMAGLALVAGTALTANRRWHPALGASLAAAGLLVGLLLVPGSRLSGGSALGLGLGAALALACAGRPRAVALSLGGLQLAGGLAPFDVGHASQPFHWLPFEALLRGSMLGNAQAMARDVWLWGCTLWCAAAGGWPVRRATVACAGIALAIEGIQVTMPSRAADLTPALLVLLLGGLLTRSGLRPALR